MKECEQHSGSLISNEKSASCLSLQIKIQLGCRSYGTEQAMDGPHCDAVCRDIFWWAR